MEERGVSVRELHRMTNLSLSSIRRLRREDMAGNLHTWKAIADALGCTVDEFMR